MTQPAGLADPIDRTATSGTIVVVGLAVVVLVFAFVGTIAAEGRESAVANGVAYVLVGVALLNLVASILVRRVGLQPSRLARVFAAVGMPGLSRHIFKTTVLSAVLAESVAMFGLLFGILTGDTYYLYALCCIALVAVLSNVPRRARLRALASEMATHQQLGDVNEPVGLGS